MRKRPQPIWIHCEGSGCPTTGADVYRICSMCGAPMDDSTGPAPAHQRQDIIAMIGRGDFDA